MVFVEGGKFSMGVLSDFDIRMTASDTTLFSTSVPKRTNVDPFYISATEVTNGEWKEFYQDKIKELGEVKGKRKYFPDTSQWVKEFPYSYNGPMAKNYFSQAKFDNFPVVGITWDQANAYCHWKTTKLKVLLDKKGVQGSIEFRLPTEAEWEYAAIKIEKKKKYYTRSSYAWSEEKGLGELNKLTNIGQIHDINNVRLKQYADDGCLYTCEVASYPPNSKGLYDMGGNVSEWTSDQGYSISYNTQTNEALRLESLDDIENEISRLQQELDAGNQDIQLFLDMLIHDKIVFTYNNIKICKGGSWEKGMLYAKTGSRQGISKDMPSTKLGFRIAISNVDQGLKKYFPKKNWKPKKK